MAFPNKYGLDPRVNHILFFGVRTPRKRVDLTIKGFAHALPNLNNWDLVFAGGVSSHYDNYGNELDTLIDQLDIREDITITGYIESDDIPAILNTADILIQTPEYRPSASGPVSLGIGYQLPMLLTNVDIYTERLTHRESAYLVDPNPEAISHAINDLAKNPELRNKLAEGTQSVADKHSWERVATKTKDIYQSLVD